jgi:hypothetical protein
MFYMISNHYLQTFAGQFHGSVFIAHDSKILIICVAMATTVIKTCGYIEMPGR